MSNAALSRGITPTLAADAGMAPEEEMTMRPDTGDGDLLAIQVATLFVLTESGRIRHENDLDRSPGPRFSTSRDASRATSAQQPFAWRPARLFLLLVPPLNDGDRVHPMKLPDHYRDAEQRYGDGHRHREKYNTDRQHRKRV